MQIVAHFNIAPLSDAMEKRGLNDGGKVQIFVDNECIRQMEPYTPFLNGVLQISPLVFTDVGSGRIIQNTPYARYQYYGHLMVDPITHKGCFYDPKTGRKWSRPGVKKVLTGTPLKYNQTRSPKAGPHWFGRMVNDKGADIGQGAAKIAGGYFSK